MNDRYRDSETNNKSTGELLPEIEIPQPVVDVAEEIPELQIKELNIQQELLDLSPRRSFISTVVLFALIGLGLGIMIGVGFLLG